MGWWWCGAFRIWLNIHFWRLVGMLKLLVVSNIVILLLLSSLYIFPNMTLDTVCRVFLALFIGIEYLSITKIDKASRHFVSKLVPTSDILVQLQQNIVINARLSFYRITTKWSIFLLMTAPISILLYLNGLNLWIVLFLIVKLVKYFVLLTWKKQIISCIPTYSVMPA